MSEGVKPGTRSVIRDHRRGAVCVVVELVELLCGGDGKAGSVCQLKLPRSAAAVCGLAPRPDVGSTFDPRPPGGNSAPPVVR